MKEGWKMVKLGEVCEKITDGSHNPPKGIEHSNYFMLSSQNVQDGYLFMDSVRYLSKENFELENKRTKAQKGDVLLTIVGTIGRACVLKGNEGNITFQRSVALMKPIETLDSYYLMYYFLCQNKDLNLKANGAAQKGIYLKQLVNYPIILPPLEEQHRIVGILDAAFAKIDALKKNAEENLKNAKALFQQVLAQELKPKEGWSLVQIRDVALLITKGASPKWQGNKYVEDDGILFVTSENVREGYIDISTPKYVDKTFNLKQQRSILYKDDVLVNIVGASIGRSAIFDLDIIDANINQAVALVRLDKTRLIPRLLCLYLNSNLAFEKYNSMKKDTARANLSLENIGDIELYIPKNITEQHRIVRTLDTLSEKCRRLEEVAQQTIRECDALKQSILRQAFSGEL